MKQTFFLNCTQLATTTLPLLARASIILKGDGFVEQRK
jgi:hypothetical protein